jgi:hypothetical protein
MQNLRELYRPNKLNLLFIGESPPAGGTFFYAGNSLLFRYTRNAFSEALNQEWQDTGKFLSYFKSAGCYLEDLCLNPINGLTRPERRRQHTLGIVPLANRLSSWKNQPHAVIIIGCSIEHPVTSSLTRVNWNEKPIYILPFPGNSHQTRYVSELVEILKDATKNNWI